VCEKVSNQVRHIKNGEEIREKRLRLEVGNTQKRKLHKKATREEMRVESKVHFRKKLLLL
jgi:hypothetical protein